MIRPGFVFRVLRHRNYRLYFSGQIVSMTGTWMQRVAEGWLVYRLTGSALALGTVRFAGQLPSLLLMPVTGVFADQRNRHRILIATQAGAMLQAALLCVLVLTGFATVELVALLAFAGGVLFAVEAPARQSFVVQMVPDREDLSNAIALNSALFNTARIAGPSLAGLIVAALGEGPVFGLNSISYLAVIYALLVMKPGVQETRLPRGNVMGSLGQGVAYSMKVPAVRVLLAALAFQSIFSFNFITIMPVFAREVFGGDARTLGFLLAAVGMGAIAGAVFVSSTTSPKTLWRWLPLSPAMLSAGLGAFSLSRALVSGLAALPLAGFGMITFMTSCNTILQHLVPDDMRGRVMSLYTFSVMGAMPLGSLLWGALAEAWGAPAASWSGCAAAALACAVMARVARVIEPFGAEEPAGGTTFAPPQE
ncbi:MFS transporter [Candidatus Fermentibacteria bacterium]|nr:MFS transporter [Candidatus Fermentibacteria bacterium]